MFKKIRTLLVNLYWLNHAKVAASEKSCPELKVQWEASQAKLPDAVQTERSAPLSREEMRTIVNSTFLGKSDTHDHRIWLRTKFQTCLAYLYGKRMKAICRLGPQVERREATRTANIVSAGKHQRLKGNGVGFTEQWEMWMPCSGLDCAKRETCTGCDQTCLRSLCIMVHDHTKDFGSNTVAHNGHGFDPSKSQCERGVSRCIHGFLEQVLGRPIGNKGHDGRRQVGHDHEVLRTPYSQTWNLVADKWETWRKRYNKLMHQPTATQLGPFYPRAIQDPSPTACAATVLQAIAYYRSTGPITIEERRLATEQTRLALQDMRDEYTLERDLAITVEEKREATLKYKAKRDEFKKNMS
jgi:hypothetical protein